MCSTLSMSLRAIGTMLDRKIVCFRIIPGACSEMVRRSSTARKRVWSSRFSAVTICSDIVTRGSRNLRKSFGASSATAMNSSSDCRDDSSSFSLSAVDSTPNMTGTSPDVDSSVARCSEIATTKLHVALSAARRTSLLASCRVAEHSSSTTCRFCTSTSLAAKVRRAMMSIALSRSGAFAERPDWKRKGSISGQEPSGSSMIIAAISPVVSAIFLRTMCICSFSTAAISAPFSAICVGGVSWL
mmetsp:Transcript_31242/g.74178  ORF Transcript_31242/g.74178 Transcript_31242/m.74178 type:complete len:243 (+) Transcript_31242:1606-2334(+)